jgi:cyclophilin family peptidyl-prolyl cis-trans isomerase
MSKADRRARKRENKQMGRAEREAELKRRKQRSGLLRGFLVVLAIVVVFGLILWTGRNGSKKTAATTTTKPAAVCKTVSGRISCTQSPTMTIDPAKTYTATIATNVGNVVIKLDPKEAPKTVNSFVFLAKHHFYDGLIFHRVAKDFVVQGGDPTGKGSGGPGYSLPTEPPKNGYVAGSVAMANAGAGTTGSQFFLTWSAAGAKKLGGPPYLYSILGQTTQGLVVVMKMGSYAPASGDGAPTKKLQIVKVTNSES